MQLALLCGLIVCILVTIAAPFVWVALFNLAGLKRLSQRLTIVEDECDRFDAKGKSLQSQIRKTKVRTEPPDEDAEINASLDRMMRGNGADPNPVRVPRRGGKLDG